MKKKREVCVDAWCFIIKERKILFPGFLFIHISAELYFSLMDSDTFHHHTMKTGMAI